jgi:hypothetical protein
VRAPVLAAALVLAGAPLAWGFDTAPEPYRAAALAGNVGVVGGRAYEERRQPADAERALVGTVVTLVPRSPKLLEDLDAIRRGARESAGAFRASADALRRAREAYERALLEAGFPDLVVTLAVGPSGEFALEGVPAGDWILIASRSVFVSKPSPREKAKLLGSYARGTRMIGYDAVTVWVRELRVAAGRGEPIELTDRNAWFTGVVEERVLDAGG